MEKFFNSNSEFALKLFKQVSTDGKSAFLSPASITAALAMTFAGAAGETKHQMVELMFNGLNDEEINAGCQTMIKSINDPEVKGYTLKTANRVYVEKTYELLQDYLTCLKKYFHSECISANFKCDCEIVRQEINQWVSHSTNEKIQNLIPGGVLDASTALVLVNAIYFKGDWKKPFQENYTQKQKFNVTADNTIDVDMMHGKHKEFHYTATEKCKVLGIPYDTDSNLTMFFILPTERNELHKLEAELTGPTLIDLFKQVHKGEVEVQLPKFKLEDSFSLNEAFKQLGCTNMFSGKADFSKISGSKDLFVSAILHKAFIEVNEKGSEAAAATAVIMKRCCCAMPLEPRKFIADHPFLFAIVEPKTMTILFLGHYYG